MSINTLHGPWLDLTIVGLKQCFLMEDEWWQQHHIRSLPAPCWTCSWRESPSTRTFVPSLALLPHNSRHRTTSLKLTHRPLNARQASQLGRSLCSSCSRVPQRRTLHRRMTSIINSRRQHFGCERFTAAARKWRGVSSNGSCRPPLSECACDVGAVPRTVLDHRASHYDAALSVTAGDNWASLVSE